MKYNNDNSTRQTISQIKVSAFSRFVTLFYRLSKIAGIQLTKGNSDITDLSDANRPTKLAEKWSSLYTDEWSDAFDVFKTIMQNENCEIEKELCSIAQVYFKKVVERVCRG